MGMGRNIAADLKQQSDCMFRDGLTAIDGICDRQPISSGHSRVKFTESMGERGQVFEFRMCLNLLFGHQLGSNPGSERCITVADFIPDLIGCQPFCTDDFPAFNLRQFL